MSSVFKLDIEVAMSRGIAAEWIRVTEITKELEKQIPLLARCRQCPGGPGHAEDLLSHLLGSLEAVKHQPVRLQWAALLHDIGKPDVMDIDPKTGLLTFHKHEVEGLKPLREIAIDLDFSTDLYRYLQKMIKHHMFYFRPDSTDRAFKKWLFNVGPEIDDLILLRLADRKGNKAKVGKALITKNMKMIQERIRKIRYENAVIFEEEVNISRAEIRKINPNADMLSTIKQLMGLINQDPCRNTKRWIKGYLSKQ